MKKKKRKRRKRKGRKCQLSQSPLPARPAGEAVDLRVSGANWAGVCGGWWSCRTFPEPGPGGSSHHSWAPRPGEPQWPEAGELALVARGGTGQRHRRRRKHARTHGGAGQAWQGGRWTGRESRRGGAELRGRGPRGPTAQHRPHGQAPTLHAGLPHSGHPPGPWPRRGCGLSCGPRQARTNKVAELIDQVGAFYSVHSRVKCSNKNLWTSASCFNSFLLLK